MTSTGAAPSSGIVRRESETDSEYILRREYETHVIFQVVNGTSPKSLVSRGTLDPSLWMEMSGRQDFLELLETHIQVAALIEIPGIIEEAKRMLLRAEDGPEKLAAAKMLLEVASRKATFRPATSKSISGAIMENKSEAKAADLATLALERFNKIARGDGEPQ